MGPKTLPTLGVWASPKTDAAVHSGEGGGGQGAWENSPLSARFSSKHKTTLKNKVNFLNESCEKIDTKQLHIKCVFSYTDLQHRSGRIYFGISLVVSWGSYVKEFSFFFAYVT